MAETHGSILESLLIRFTDEAFAYEGLDNKRRAREGGLGREALSFS